MRAREAGQGGKRYCEKRGKQEVRGATKVVGNMSSLHRCECVSWLQSLECRVYAQLSLGDLRCGTEGRSSIEVWTNFGRASRLDVSLRRERSNSCETACATRLSCRRKAVLPSLEHTSLARRCLECFMSATNACSSSNSVQLSASLIICGIASEGLKL